MQIHYFENEGGPVIGSANGKVIRRAKHARWTWLRDFPSMKYSVL